jgi:hypothetical protein
MRVAFAFRDRQNRVERDQWRPEKQTISRTRRRLIAVGLALPVIGVGMGWAFRSYEHARKVGEVRSDMKLIGAAYEKYHSEHGEWPEKVEYIAPLLEGGRVGAMDPWGQPYVVQVEDVTQPDGKVIQRPVVYCQPPGDRPRLQWPEE